MKRIVVRALGALLVAGSVGVMGCDSGGIDPGMPKDTTPAIPPEKMKEMADMSKGPKQPTTPPGDKAAPAPEKAPAPSKP
jgi:hypothetical protein